MSGLRPTEGPAPEPEASGLAALRPTGELAASEADEREGEGLLAVAGG